MSKQPRVAPTAREGRYSAVAITLHWAIAAVLALQIVLGWRMTSLEGTAGADMLQLHKSVGVSILLLTLVRIVWRLVKRPPEAVVSNPLEHQLAVWVQRGFYAALLVLPLTGWAMVSLSRTGGAMKLFGVAPWPGLPMNALPNEMQGLASDALASTHSAVVWLMLALLALHVAGALRHHVLLKDSVLSRMAPGLAPGAILDPRLIAIPLVAALFAAAGYIPRPAPIQVRPAVVRIADADVYLDVVQPALNKRCVSCHNDDKAKGGLSLVNYDALMAGGRDGPVVVARVPGKSELYRRITLDPQHKRYMPADGRTSLNQDQVAAIGWWITVGAPKAGSMARTAGAPPAVMRVLGLGSDDNATAGGAPGSLPAVAKLAPAVVAEIESRGFVVRPVSSASGLVEIDVTPNRKLEDADLAALKKASAQIYALNLRSAGVSDAQLGAIGAFTNLVRLRLEDSPVTDAGLASLSGLSRLTSINLTGTRVTRAGVARLAGLPSLQRVYVWQSGAGEDGFVLEVGSRKITVLSAYKPAADSAPSPGLPRAKPEG